VVPLAGLEPATQGLGIPEYAVWSNRENGICVIESEGRTEMTGKKILICILTLILNIQVLRSGQNHEDDIILGKYQHFSSQVLGGEIVYFVHLPEGYEYTDKEFPVLYILNAQMVSTVANAIATVERLEFELIPEMIIAGICNTGVAGNYFPQRPDGQAGGAVQFLDFLTHEFIPFVNQTYRTADFRVLMGQSNTGLFSVYAYLTSPDAFQACIAASPSLGWCLDLMIEKAQPTIAKNRSPASLLYMNYGGRDYKGLVIDPVVAFKGILEEKASEGFKWRVEHLENDGHVPIATLNNGLLALFPDYFADDELRNQGLGAVDAHYERLSRRYGFFLQAPEEVIFNIGYRKKQNKEYEEAVRIFDVLLQRHPYSVRGYFHLGETYREKGDLDKARECYLKALEINPDFEAAQRRLELIRKNEESLLSSP
jgi:predicted alpha/beta superfamily hydrolase